MDPGDGAFMDKDNNKETSISHGSWLLRIGGAAALISGLLLLIGMISFIFTILRTGITSAWLVLFQDNWLIIIFKLHGEFKGMQADLNGMNPLDILFLLLVAIICLSLSTVFKKASRTWCLAAFGLSIVAIILYSATQLVGRSTVMLAVLIVSIVMFRNQGFGKVAVWAGIAASVLLFAGDLTVGVQSTIITLLFGIGYVLLTLWFFLVAKILFQP